MVFGFGVSGFVVQLPLKGLDAEYRVCRDYVGYVAFSDIIPQSRWIKGKRKWLSTYCFLLGISC